MAPTDAAEIVFDHVTKRYPGRDEAAVDDLSLTIPAGDICVLVGPSGGGQDDGDEDGQPPDRRSTEGDIRIDGTSIRDLDVDRAAARDRLRDPAGRPLPAHDRRRQHRRPCRGSSAGTRRGIRERVGELLELVGLEPEHAQALSRAALRRPAPARRPRPRARGRPAADADGRAVRRARPDHARPPAGRVPPPARARCARRSSSSRTTSTRRSSSATGSRSCARAACSRSTTRPTRPARAPRRRVRRALRRRRPRPEAARAPAARARSSSSRDDRGRRPARAGARRRSATRSR